MPPDILQELSLRRRDITQLDGSERSRLLNFLLRWEHFEALHWCLDILIPANPRLVSLLDLRARALQAEGNHDAAIQVMEKRLTIRSSMSARLRLAYMYLAHGDRGSAQEIARAIIKKSGDHISPWNLAVEVALAEGDVRRAEEACRRLRAINPATRSYLSSMVKVMQAKEDWITASSYAVRLLNAGDEEHDLAVGYLRQLRDYFFASDERTRVTEIEQVLEQRQITDWNEIRAYFGLDGTIAPESASSTKAETPASTPADSFQTVQVSDKERQAIQEAVQGYFGFPELRPGQLETLACVLRGEDVLTILPTGGGKSLCYQLPAMLAEQGLTLVVSPLIALMKDQLDSLPDPLRRKATTINSTLDGDELRRRLARIAADGYRLVYAAPERLRQPVFLHALRRGGVNRLVIDEAHCVSFWGHDFRPDYLKLGQARQALGNPPILGLTATAPPRVRRDVLQHLSPDGRMRVIAGDVTRPNLCLEVLRPPNNDAKLRHLLAFCRSESGSGIVYAGTRDRCEQLAALLCRQDLRAIHYHAGIDDRDAVQDAFMRGEARIVVATIAFGLGIDKPDIRFIVHYVPAASLEAYYQEAGRAGRDGYPARCMLMITSSDRGTLTRRMHRDQLKIDFLRRLYGAVDAQLNGSAVGRMAMGDLQRATQGDEVAIRVGLSVLEETAFIRQGPDLPRATLLRLRRPVDPEQTPALHAFSQAARLRPRQWLDLDLLRVGQKAGLPADRLETQVIEWADDGHLDYRFSGRDLLLEKLPVPADAAERIPLWLERYETIQRQRIDEISAYAKTRHCRHGHLNAYLGGREIDRCQACDNCLDIEPPEGADLPDTGEQLGIILQCAASAPWSWGRYSLLNILRGHPRAPERGQENPHFGALGFRAKSAVEKMIGLLEDAGALAPRKLDHGGEVLDLTAQGRAMIEDPARVRQMLEPTPKPAATSGPAALSKDEETLFERLRQWRLETARDQEVPAFVIFHDQTLRAIAQARPTTLDALKGIKGIGPTKIERYGEAVLAVVACRDSAG